MTGLGSSTNFLTQFLAVKNGVKLGEFTSVPVGRRQYLHRRNAARTDRRRHDDRANHLAPAEDRRGQDPDRHALRRYGTEAALGGVYPAACLYMQTDWVEQHHDEVQKLANVYVKTMRYIATHSAEEIAAQMPKDYYAGDKAMYVNALATGKQMFTADGVMPSDGPPTVLQVLSSFDKTVKGKTIDLVEDLYDKLRQGCAGNQLAGIIRLWRKHRSSRDSRRPIGRWQSSFAM